TLEQIADVAHHAGPLLLVAEEAAVDQPPLEPGKEVHELGLRRRSRRVDDELAGWRLAARLEPFITNEQNRLRQVQRGKGRVERYGDHRIGERDIVIFETRTLAAEEDANLLAPGHDLAHLARRPAWRDYPLDHAAL